MSIRTRWLAAVVAVGALGAPTLAQSPLAPVPAKAPIVVHIHGWERVLGRINATLKAAAPDYAPLLSGQIESGIATALMGRELKGLVKDGPIFIVFTEIPSGDEDVPELAAVIRVSNYTQFRDGILKEEERKELKTEAGVDKVPVEGKETYFLNKGDFAIVTPSKKALKLFQDSKTESLAGKLDKRLESKLLDADVSAYVDVAAINKKHGNDIASAKQVFENMFQQAEELGGMAFASGMAKNMIAQLFQLVEDAERVVVGLEIPPDGLSLKIHGQVGESTKTNELLKQSQRTPLAEIAKHPAGAMMYSGGTVGRSWLGSMGMMFMYGSLGAKGDPEDKAAGEAAKQLAEMKAEEWSMSAPAVTSYLTVTRYQDSAKAADLALKVYKSIKKDGTASAIPIKGAPEIKENAEKVGSFTLHSVKIAFDYDKLFEKLPGEGSEEAKQMFQKMLGNGQQIWLGSDGKVFVEVVAKDWNAAKAMLESYTSGKGNLTAVPGFMATRKRLPEQASMVGALDFARYAQTIFDTMGQQFKLLFGNENFKLAPAEGPANFLGFAVGTEPRNVTVDVWMPAEGVKQIVKMLAPLLKELDK